MKKAFTILEVIFVIVIIGLLAGIALPRLAVTRDDAKVSQVVHNIATGTQEIAAYVMSQGKLETTFSDMSNAVETMIASTEATQVGDTLNIKMGSALECITLQIDDTDNIKIINISHGNPQGDGSCIALQNVMDEKRYDMPILGQYIEY